jgi:hypothetical protein
LKKAREVAKLKKEGSKKRNTYTTSSRRTCAASHADALRELTGNSASRCDPLAMPYAACDMDLVIWSLEEVKLQAPHDERSRSVRLPR